MSSNMPLRVTHITLPDTEYATCAETYAKLLIYPGNLGVDEVSKMLELEPTHKQDKGDRLINSRGQIRFAKNSLWMLSSEIDVDSKDLRDHLNWIVEKLDKNKLGKLQLENDIKMTVTCVWWSVMGHGGPVLWPKQMKALSELNLECSFDIYFTNE